MSAAIVIGGGIAGLATAALLADEGHEVTLLEARDELGGRAGSWESGGFRWDTGPSWYLMPEVFDHFFRMLGTTAEQELDLVPLVPAYRVYTQNHPEPLEIVSGRAEARALFEGVEAGAGAKLDAYLDSAGDTYDLSVTRFLYDSYESTAALRSPEMLKRMPQLAPLLTRIARELHRQALHRSASAPGARVPGGVPRRFAVRRAEPLPPDEPPRPRRGRALPARRLHHDHRRHRPARATERGVRIETGAEVVGDHDGTRGVHGAGAASKAASKAEGDRRAPGRRAVAGGRHRRVGGRPAPQRDGAAPPAAADLPRGVVDQARAEPRRAAAAARRRGRASGSSSHHTLLFAEDWRSNFDDIFGASPKVPDPASIYVCRPSATDAAVAPAGHENLFVLVPVPADTTLGHGGVDGDGDPAVEAAADRVIAQISEWCGIPDLAGRIVERRTIAPADFHSDLHAWRGNALGLSHTLRQSAVFRPRNVSKKVDGLYYAGTSALPGIGLPMCLISAELVIKRLRGDRTAGPLPEPVALGV